MTEVWSVLHVETKPDLDDLIEGILYKMKESVLFLCPCGCKVPIWLKLSLNSYWIEYDDKGRVSLNHRVKKDTPCGSSFFIKNGKTKWWGRSGPRFLG